MFLNKPMGYDNAPSYDQERQGIPAGGYVCEIKRLEFAVARNGKQYMKVAVDIAEGPYAGIFMKRYKAASASGNAKWGCTYNVFVTEADSENTSGHFKGFCTAWERSNNREIPWGKPENVFAGSAIGLIFREEEFIGNDGTVHVSVKPCAARDTQTIRSGDYRIPERKKVENSTASTAAQPQVDQSTGYTVVDSEELPF